MPCRRWQLSDPILPACSHLRPRSPTLLLQAPQRTQTRLQRDAWCGNGTHSQGVRQRHTRSIVECAFASGQSIHSDGRVSIKYMSLRQVACTNMLHIIPKSCRKRVVFPSHSSCVWQCRCRSSSWTRRKLMRYTILFDVYITTVTYSSLSRLPSFMLLADTT